MTEAKFKDCEISITSVAAFLKYVMEIKATQKPDLVFRGQQKNWSLIPKLRRFEWNGEMFNLEKVMFKEFVRITPRLAEFAMNDEWDQLAVAQHHGLPTRLIDWTYSAATALWFAVKDHKRVPDDKLPAGDDAKTPGPAIVWILRTIKEDFDDVGNKSPFEIENTQLYRPRVIAHRIQAQAGLFSVHTVKSRADGTNDFIPLEVNSVMTDRLIRIKIDACDAVSLRRELDVIGVNESTMYPSLDGVCKHLEWRFTKIQLPDAMVAARLVPQ